eukprot:GDKI01030972.1.p1 GENE.GDKI01030972.1~~GDKI01030972.1.p1  ORF type:complete len:284 (+),score=107.65 GDKI01030972.1:18-869(+)
MGLTFRLRTGEHGLLLAMMETLLGEPIPPHMAESANKAGRKLFDKDLKLIWPEANTREDEKLYSLKSLYRRSRPVLDTEDEFMNRLKDLMGVESANFQTADAIMHKLEHGEQTIVLRDQMHELLTLTGNADLIDTFDFFLPKTLRSQCSLRCEFYDFVRLCLQLDPAHRPTARQLLEHPFIRDTHAAHTHDEHTHDEHTHHDEHAHEQHHGHHEYQHYHEAHDWQEYAHNTHYGVGHHEDVHTHEEPDAHEHHQQHHHHQHAPPVHHTHHADPHSDRAIHWLI